MALVIWGNMLDLSYQKQNMDQAEATRFAEQWIESFNRRKIENILCHFAGNAIFSSPRAEAFGFSSTLYSRDDLTAYWEAAMRSIGSLHFTLDRAVYDAEERTLVILYFAEIDGMRKRASEIYTFDRYGQVVRGEAMYGAIV